MLSRVLLLCAVLAAASCQHNVPSQIERRLYSVGCPGQNIRLECRSQTVVACDGQDVNLKCDDGVISVLKASYGRFDQNTCTSTPSVMTFCASSTAELHVRDLCKGKKECTISANAQALGKPESCDDLPKYLTVDYVCTKKIRL
ncbi:uncharacterized protein V6R79_011440 [Siganus canaliculatus]